MTAPPLARTTAQGRCYVHPVTEEAVPSVTTIISGGVPKPALTGWAARTAAEYAVENWATLTALEPEERVTLIKGAHRRRSTTAADLGTAVHDACDHWVRDEPMPQWEDGVEPFMEQFCEFLETRRPEFLMTEVTVWNRTHGYAGTFDWLARINGKVTLGDHKGLALDTPLPTPQGWTTMGAVQVGDTLFDAVGQPCRVTLKSDVHLKRCYRVRFDDGSEIICDHDHRWVTTTGDSRRPKTAVTTTEDMALTLRRFGQRDHRVAVAGALSLPDIDLPVHPYVLGCWIGDGKHTSGEIASAEPVLYDLIAACGYQVGPNIGGADRCPSRTVYKLRGQLGRAGLLGHKTIPEIYLRASVSQRLALLQGLLDTDGSWNKGRSQAVFSSTDKALATDVRELVLSLGQRAILNSQQVRGFGKQITYWQVPFTPNGIQPFRIPRKADLVSVPTTARARRRVVVSVEPTVTVRTQCIAVDSPDHTYLCGESMIPTHNTGNNVYPEVGLQLSALAHAEFILRPDGTEEPLPAVELLGARLREVAS